MQKRGFTLIELLVVVAIIALLGAIMFPVFAKSREQARKATCQSNLKQIGTAIEMYVQDYDRYPVFTNGLSGWGKLLYPYIAGNLSTSYLGTDKMTLYFCPSDNVVRANAGRTKKSYALSGGTDASSSSGDGISWFQPGWALPCESVEASQVLAPADTILVAEYWNASNYIDGGDSIVRASVTGVTTGYHNSNGSRNYLFCDGHVRLMSSQQTVSPKNLWTRNPND